MELYLKRMLTEEKELKGRIKKASDVIETNPFRMNSKQKKMLVEQVSAMKEYLGCLSNRIEYEKNR